MKDTVKQLTRPPPSRYARYYARQKPHSRNEIERILANLRAVITPHATPEQLSWFDMQASLVVEDLFPSPTTPTKE